MSPFVTYPFLADGAVLALYWNGEPNLRAIFDAGGSQEIPPTAEENAAREQLLNGVSAQVSDFLLTHQKNVYFEIVEQLKGGGEIHDAAKILTGAKALLRSFLELGMAVALGADDLLRAMLYGNQAILDEELVFGRYAVALNALPSANVRWGISDDAQQRIEATTNAAHGYLDAIGQDQYSEQQYLVEHELLRSNAIDVFVAQAASGGHTQTPNPHTSKPTPKPDPGNGCLKLLGTAAVVAATLSIAVRALSSGSS